MKHYDSSFSFKNVALSMRLLQDSDNEFIRNLKNEQREFFFYKAEISTVQQLNWFTAYKSRDDDYMFVILAGTEYVGCMGIRLLDDHWDIYNVMVGNDVLKGRGIMSACFQKMLQFASVKKPAKITLKVLKNNPAVTWYVKQGLEITVEKEDYFEMSKKTN